MLAALVTADDYHCELQLQTGSDGLDSSDNTLWGGVGGQVTSADLTAATVVFNAGVATFDPVKVAKTAGRYFRLKVCALARLLPYPCLLQTTSTFPHTLPSPGLCH